jgi:hypothetical protein
VKDRQVNFGMYSGAVEIAGESTAYGDVDSEGTGR